MEILTKLNTCEECFVNLFVTNFVFIFCYSASGTSAVAIDNKIEQAMVSNMCSFCTFFLQAFLIKIIA